MSLAWFIQRAPLLESQSAVNPQHSRRGWLGSEYFRSCCDNFPSEVWDVSRLILLQDGCGLWPRTPPVPSQN